MKKEIPWELIISDLKQDISDADKKHLEEWVSIDENRKMYEELRYLQHSSLRHPDK